MIRKIVILSFALVALPVLAAQVEADAPVGATQCGFYLDAVVSPTVVSVTAGKCRYNVASVAVGAHTVSAEARYPDPIWGTTISPKSAPFSFTKPGPNGASPSNFTLVP